MSKKRIVIFDDEKDFGESLKEALERIEEIGRGFEIDFEREALPAAIEALQKRLKSARARDSNDVLDEFPDDDAGIIDDASILVIDYDLVDLDPSLTSEGVAYLARCYSNCGTIVALNRYPPRVEQHFDLTLDGHPESFADLNIPSDSLGNPGLWREPWGNFRPWSWPLLPQAHEAFEKRRKSLIGYLDEPIFNFFGLHRIEALHLPRTIVEFITAAEDPSSITFRDFVRESGNGFHLKDRPLTEEAVARIAAARLFTWLENVILPRQDILVDAPHLVSRYSSLLQGDRQEIGVWNGIATIANSETLGLDSVIDPFRFTKSEWLSRPVWFWGEISNCEEIKEVSDPWSVERYEYAFCEDTSSFLPKEKTKEFVADIESSYVRRRVEYIDDIEYSPRVRFSM